MIGRLTINCDEIVPRQVFKNFALHSVSGLA
jgi:hypothetical protein